MIRLQDLTGRQRELVLRLWRGETIKEAAAGMAVTQDTTIQMVRRIARKLPGRGLNVQKITLWRSTLILDAIPDVTKNGLKPLIEERMFAPSDATTSTRGAA